MRGWVWCVQSSERTEKRIRKRPIGAGIDPKKQAKPARFAEDVSEIVDQLNSGVEWKVPYWGDMYEL